jgi:hypothetical protein
MPREAISPELGMDFAISFCEWFLIILVHGWFYSFGAFFGRVRAFVLYFSCKFGSFDYVSSAFFMVAEVLLHGTQWVVCRAHGR